MDDETALMLISVILFFSCFMLAISTSNNIDVNDLGKYMCEQHEKDFVMSEYEFGFFKSSLKKLKITCSEKEQKNETQIDDGYLVILK